MTYSELQLNKSNGIVNKQLQSHYGERIEPEKIAKNPDALVRKVCAIGIDPRGVRTTIWQSSEIGPDPKYTDHSDRIARVETAIKDFQNDADTTGRSFKYLMDLVQGRYAKRGFKNRGKADHSDAEFHLAGLLYGVITQYDDTNNPTELVRIYITHACREYRYADDGDVRKWLRRDNPRHTFKYRQETVQRAIYDFDRNRWKRWQSTKESWDTWSDDYSDIVYQAVFDGLVSRNGRYPTRKEVIEIAQSLNPERSKESHDTALRRLQSEYQQVKMAFCPDRENGKRYIYYPAHDPDPADARWVKIGGEKRKPE